MHPSGDVLSEEVRLLALSGLDVMDSMPEQVFDALANAAALACGVSVALLNLVDRDRVWAKACAGWSEPPEATRDLAFCSRVILADSDDVFEVPDTLLDERFSAHPFVLGEPKIRFYAGALLCLSNGARVGTLCVVDHQPRRLSESQRKVLRQLAACAVHALESRRDARALASSEANFQALFDAAPLGMFVTDARGSCTYTNARWHAISGLSLAESLGHGWRHTVHPDDKASVYAEWQRTSSQQVNFDRILRVRNRDGRIADVRVIARPLVNDFGVVTGFVGSVEDISAQQRADHTLRTERQRLALIIDATGAGTWEWNVQTGEIRFNERWAGLLGTTVDALQPISIQTWVSHVHPEDLVRSNGLLEQHFSGENAGYECEVRMRHKDGHWVWILDRGRVVTRTPEGDPEWMFGTHVDITARKQRQEHLRKSELLLNQTGALANVGGWELDFSHNVPLWTAQTRRIHEVAADYQPNLADAIDFYAPEARPVLRAAIAKAMADGSSFDIEVALQTARDRLIWVRVMGRAEYESGTPVRLLGAIQDISDRVAEREALRIANERMTLATASGMIGVWDYDLLSGALSGDAAMYQLYGVDQTSNGTDYDFWARYVYCADRDRIDREVAEAIAGSGVLETEFRIIDGAGALKYIRGAGSVTHDASGAAIRMTGINTDITALRSLTAELAEQHALLQVTLQSIGDAVITTDNAARVNWLNPVAERLTGWITREAFGKPIAQVYHVIGEETRRPILDAVVTCLRHGAVVGSEQRTLLLSRNGEEFGIEDTVSPIRNAGGELFGAVLVFHDVSAQRRLSSEMSYRATHDALTGLVNRSEFELRLCKLLDEARHDGSRHAVMYIDLDEFKLVNEAGGHSVGDQLLAKVASLLAGTVRARDTLARLGGDEFGVILERCSIEDAQRVAQLVCERMDTYRFSHGERRFRIGTSIGVVPLDDRWTTTAAMMQAVDNACYAAKEGGRNRVHVWVDSDETLRERRDQMQWAARLEQAIDAERFVLFGQRIEPIDPHSNDAHLEVLLRMIDDDGSLIAPGAFLPAAERFHLSSRIDRWVLQQSIALLSSPLHARERPTLCVNVSGQSIGDRGFHRLAIEQLQQAGPETCRRLCLEITETAAVTNMADASVFIDQVRALGVRIALDDFGAGASSFGYLKTLKVDILKIDGQFVRNLVSDPLDDAAVRCFVDVARVIGVKTVAEFVDSPAVLSRLREIGVDFAQGYLLHRPAPIDDVLGMTANNSPATINT